MAASRLRLDIYQVWSKAPRSPGPLGKNDAADPDFHAGLGDTPGPLGINDGAGLIAERWRGVSAKITLAVSPLAALPTGYLIQDQGVKALLPDLIWEKARTRTNEVFKDAGKLEASYVGEGQMPPKPQLIDAVVRIYLNSTQASVGFRVSVYNQLINLSHSVQALKALALNFNKPDNYKVDAGRSYILKKKFASTLVCITDGAVSLAEAFKTWAGLGLSMKRTKATLDTIKTAQETEQLGFGIALGNLIAHEIRHQLARSSTGAGMGHSGSGLGMDGADSLIPI